MKLLLHACCGPCSLEPTHLLKAAGHDITIYYANSNIHPAEEYQHRLATLRAWASAEGFDVLEGPYNPASWENVCGRIGDAAIADVERQRTGAAANSRLQSVTDAQAEEGGEDNRADLEAASAATGARSQADVHAAAVASTCGGNDSAEHASQASLADSTPAGEHVNSNAPAESAPLRAAVLSVDPARREARCRACYRMRLEETARVAAERGFDGIGTTLSVSPYQYTDVIREEVERAAAGAGVAPVFEDFRPYYDEATRRSRQLGMYRQNFCGCRISDLEAAAERAERKAERAAAKAAERAAHASERAAEQAARARHKAERAAYDQKQARKRAILKALREQGK